MTAASAASGMLQHDALDRVRHVLQLVEGALDLVDDVLPHEQVPGRVLGGVGVEAVQLGPGVPVEPVTLVLQLVDADPVVAQRLLLELAQVPDPTGGLHARLLDQAGLLDHHLDGLGDPVQHQHVRGRLERVDHVVQVAGEGVDVLAVERGDEGGVQPGEDRVGEPVGLVLAGCGGDNGGTSGCDTATGGSDLASLSGELKASGGSFPDAYYQEVISAFKAAAPGVTVTYNSTGSGTGKKEFGQGLTDFAGSDSLVKDSDGVAAGSFMYVPTVAAPITVSYNLSGVDKLQLSPDTLAKIFQRA